MANENLYGSTPLWEQAGLEYDPTDIDSIIGYLNSISQDLYEHVPQDALDTHLMPIVNRGDELTRLLKSVQPEYYAGLLSQSLEKPRSDYLRTSQKIRHVGSGLESTPERRAFKESTKKTYESGKLSGQEKIAGLTSEAMGMISKLVADIMGAHSRIGQGGYRPEEEKGNPSIWGHVMPEFLGGEGGFFNTDFGAPDV